MVQGALAGLRLIEMGQLIAGPFCGQLMGDHGAEVIKIEPPKVGDAMRSWGQGIPLWFSVVGRNKKSITLNLREKEGQDIVRRLVEKSDFLLENFRAGTMEKWNLGYEALSAINKGLIMIRVSGYGQNGPYSSRPDMAASVRRWAACAILPVNPIARRVGQGSPSEIPWPRPMPVWGH